MNKYLKSVENGFEVVKVSFHSDEDYNKVLISLNNHLELVSDISGNSILLYEELYNYKSLGKQSDLINSLFFRMRVPEYSSVRFEILNSGRFVNSSFKIGLSIFNKKQQEIHLIKKIGAFYLDQEGTEYFLSPPTIKFIDAWTSFKLETLKTEFNKSMSFRLNAYSKLVNAYDLLEVQGVSILDTFKVKIIDDLDYNLIGNDDGSLDIVPAFDKELGGFNSTINNIAENSKMFSDNIDLKDPKKKKNYKVIFSEKASEKWKAFAEIKRMNKENRSDSIRNGKFLGDYPPKQVIGSIFSDRVTGFILDSPEKVSRDNDSSVSWNEGFDDVSNLLQSTSGSGYSISLNPAPEIYSEIKKCIIEMNDQHSKLVNETKAITGAIHTDPIIKPISVFVESLKDEFTLAELETLVERIERNNKPELFEADLNLVKSLVSDAKNKGEFVALWTNINNEDVKIPIRSLEMAIKELDIDEVINKTLNVQIAENLSIRSNEETGLSDSWYINESIEKFAISKSFRSNVKLRPHQVKGYAWLHGLATNDKIYELCGARGALLADDMGLGKTIQVIRLIDSFRTDFGKSEKPILIVGPVSLLKTSWENDGLKAFFNDQFLNENKVIHLKDVPRTLPRAILLREVLEFERHINDDPLKNFKTLVLSDEVNEYLSDFKLKISNSIVFCSYETLRSRIFELASIDFSLVVLDEAQKIKNSSTGQTRAAKALKAEMKVAMTGTPIENSITDLWSICDFAVKDYLGPLKNFREKYLNRILRAEPGSPERKEIAEQLEKELKPIWLRRTKKEVLKNGEIPKIHHYDSCQLPDGTLYNKHLVQMSNSQFEVFQTQVGYFNESKSGHKLTAIRNMLEACYAPWWAKGLQLDIVNSSQLFELSSKLKITFDVLQEIAMKDEKVIIFVNILELQHELSSFIHSWYFKTFGKSVDCEFFNGDFSLEERGAMLDRFKNAKGFKAIIISPRTGGAGLNIVEANHVIHYTREWNPAVERQATDRAHRIGQQKEVHVYYPTSSLISINKTTAEEHLASILQAKREVIDDFTVSEGELGLGEKQFDKFIFSTDGTILTPEGVVTLDPYKFEKLICLFYESLGYKVEHIGGAGDAGCDIICLSSSKNIVVQVKFTEINHPQGTAAINEARGAKSRYEQEYGCIFSLVAVTNSVFSPNAHSHSYYGDLVELIEGDRIRDFIINEKIYLSQLK